MGEGAERSSEATAADIVETSLKLVEAQAQIEELVELNKRLRTELSEMTFMWVGAVGQARHPIQAVRQAVDKLRRAFGGKAPVEPIRRSVRDYQMLGALSALKQGHYNGLVIPTVELLALGYAEEIDGVFWISPVGETVLRSLRAALLNTGQRPVGLGR